jgi:anaerobic selenocysteine-containing dehydrogenase
MSDAINRRDFLVFGGATLAGVTLGETGRRWMARADERVGVTRSPAVETWANSVCRECPAGCGVSVRLLDRTPVKLEGNPLCPVSRGRLCAKGQAAIEAYFDPDRLVGPARRVGRRGDRRWSPIGWDEAITLVATHLTRARAHAGSIVAIGADEHGPIADAWTQFWSPLRARVGWTQPFTGARLQARFAALTGAAGDPVFDLEHATHVLSFGAPIAEDWLSPLWTQRSFGRFRRGPSGSRGRLVQVDGRRSLTARKADEWLPVATDRQAFLAYGVASVLLRENRVDRARLAAAGGNLAAFENAVVARYTPDDVAVATGIPVVTLLRIARDLVASPRPLVVVAADAGPDLVDAVFALNALVGAVARPGGLLESASPHLSDHHDRNAAAELIALTTEHQPQAVVAFRDASALRAFDAPATAGAALEDAGLVVSFSPYLDEAAELADLLLPTHTSLESWHAMVPSASDGTQKLACAGPAAAPRLDTKDLVSVLRAIAERMGGDMPAACPAASSADVIQAELGRVWDLRRGGPYSTAFETDWVLQLERGGWWVAPASSREEFSKAVLQAGGWLDPYFAAAQVGGSLEKRGGFAFAVPDALPAGLKAAPTAAGVVPASLDTGARAASGGADFPLRLVTFTPSTVNMAGSPNQPVLFELLGQPDGAPWRVWAEMNAETARQAGIDHGASMRIASSSGPIEVVAMVVEKTPPETVVVAFVPALASSGRWARLVAADVRQLWGRRATGEPLAVRVTRA